MLGPWSSGYDVSLTRRGSPVRVRLGPPYSIPVLSRESRVLDNNSGNKSIYENLHFKHTEDFFEWTKVQGFSKNHVTHLKSYYRKHFQGKVFKGPFSLQKYIFSQETGHKGQILATRAYLRFCEENSKEDPVLIEKFRKILKLKATRNDYYVPSNEDVITAYKILKKDKTLQLLFLVLATAGIRIVEAIDFLRNYDEKKFVLHETYVTYSVSDTRHTKNINNIYLPRFVYEHIFHIKKTYDPVRGSVKEKGLPFSLKYLRKWQYNFMIYNQVPESVADFVQGRVSSSIGANHYMAKSQQAEFWFAKIVEEFEKIIYSS